MPGALADDVVRMQRAGATAVLVEDNGQTVGAIAVRDELRPEAAEVVAQLRRDGYHVAMLTGDNQTTAAALAKDVGIDDVHAELRPEDKARLIEELRASATPPWSATAINDAPALATADLGIAMGAMGTDVAIETADVALMGEDLRHLPQAFSHARRARRIMLQNVGLSLALDHRVDTAGAVRCARSGRRRARARARRGRRHRQRCARRPRQAPVPCADRPARITAAGRGRGRVFVTRSAIGEARMIRARIILAITVVLLAGPDLALKTWAARELTAGQTTDLGLAQLRLAFNPGVGFGLGDTLPAGVVLGGTGLIVAGLAVFAYRFTRTATLPVVVAMAALLAGAVANLIDRAADGVVTDYLHTGWFPTFNLADIFVVGGAAILVLASLHAGNGTSPRPQVRS